MNNIDKQYIDLLKDILENGIQKTDRTGTGTISVFGRQIRHKMSDGFPLLTTKKMYFKGIVTELLWFLRGDTNIKYLLDNDCHIWDGDAYKNYCEQQSKKLIKGCTYQEFVEKIKTDDEFAQKWGELGPIYGKQWRRWNKFGDWEEYDAFNNSSFKVEGFEYIDQIQNLINDLKTNPDSRRLMVNAWNVGELDQMVLPPCHYGFQVYTRELSLEERLKIANNNDDWKSDVKLEYKRGIDCNLAALCNIHNIPTRAISLMWNQRSVDTPLGLPFNIASYGLLLEIIAKMVNMVPDELIGNLGDCHIYSNQIDGVKEQIGRELTFEERIELYNGPEKDSLQTSWGTQIMDEANVPKRTREPYLLPKINLNSSQTDAFWKALSEDLSLFEHLDGKDWVKLEGYQSHPTIKFPLSN